MSTFQTNLKLFCLTIGAPTVFLSEFVVNKSILMYLIVMLIIIIPITFMELAIGQYSQLTSIKVWDLCPLLRGVGIGEFVLLFQFQIHFVVILSYLSYYTLSTFSYVLPWSHCNATWATIACYTTESNASRWQNCLDYHNPTFCKNLNWENAEDQFFRKKVLNLNPSYLTKGFFQFDEFHSEMAIHGLINCLIIFFGSYSGMKLLLILSVVPSLQLLLLFFISFMDRGSFTGTKYVFANMHSSAFWNASEWSELIKHTLQTNGVGTGVLITIGAEYPFRTPIYFRSIVVNLISWFFCLMYGVTTYNILASLSNRTFIDFQALLKVEQDLFYCKMARAMKYVPFNTHFMSAMFYSNLYLLSYRSAIAITFLQLKILFNSWPNLRKYRLLCRALYCALIYCGGLIIYTPSGYYVQEEIIIILTEAVIPVMVVIELVGVMWLYGVMNFSNDIHFMLGVRPLFVIQLLLVICPVIIVALYIYDAIMVYQSYAIVQKIYFWLWYIFIIVFVMHHVKKTGCKNVLMPASTWGPMDPTLRKSRLMFNAHSMTKEYIYRHSRLKRDDFEIDDEPQADNDVI